MGLLLPFVALSLLPTPAQAPSLRAENLARVAMQPQSIAVLRDAYGVPHIFAGTEAGACYGLGYAQASDRLEALLRNLKQARGELAEIEGEGALESDLRARAFLLLDAARNRYASLPAEVRADIEAFCAGANRWQRENPARRPFWAFEIAPTDVVAFGLLVNLAFANDPFERVPRAEPAPGGSNGFVVAAKRTGAGQGSLVSIDPHLPWSGFYRWYEAHLSGGGMDVQGVTFVGLPYIAMGHNGRVAWANTVNAPDLSDLFEERLSGGNGQPVTYEYDGQARPVITREFWFRVRRPDGSLEERMRPVGYTHHGPLLVRAGNRTFAVKKAGWGDVQLFTQARAQGLAKNVEEFKQALSGRHIALFNSLFGDATGRVGYVWGGQIPVRAAGYDYRQPVPGWLSATDWREAVPFERLPQCDDPPEGFFKNANDSPFASGAGANLKPSSDPKEYPGWLAPEIRTLRGDRLMALLTAAKGIEIEQAKAIATDVVDLNAAGQLPALLEALGKALPAATGADRETLDACRKALAGWDRTLRTSARGAALFQAWLAQPEVRPVAGEAPFAQRDPEAALRALRAAAGQMQQRKLPLDIAWGVIHRHRRGKVDLPLDGGAESLVPNRGPAGPDGKSVAAFGSSFRMLVRLRPDAPVQVFSATPYGISDDPASKHYTDQMGLAARCEYRLLPFTRAAVEKEATAKWTLVWPEPAKAAPEKG